MTKVPAPYLYRKRGIYYLQKRIPKPLVLKYGRSILQRSLRTTNRADAVRLSSSIVSSLEREWQALLFDIPNTSASAFYHLTSGHQHEPLLTEAMQLYLKDGGKDLDFRLCQATNTVIKSVVSLVGDKTLSAYSRNQEFEYLRYLMICPDQPDGVWQGNNFLVCSAAKLPLSNAAPIWHSIYGFGLAAISFGLVFGRLLAMFWLGLSRQCRLPKFTLVPVLA